MRPITLKDLLVSPVFVPSFLALGFIVIVLVLGQNYLGRRDFNDRLRAECFTSTGLRVTGAVRAAYDSIGERYLADTSKGREQADHENRSLASSAVANASLAAAGVPGTTMERIAVMDKDDPSVVALRRAYCERVNPDPPFFELP